MSNNEITAAVQAAIEQEPASQASYRRMSDIAIEPIKWLWKGRIALGKLTVIAGDPGMGKSQITASIAAIATNGGQWPDGAPATTPGSVIFLSAEDNAADTIKPRLIAAGAVVEDIYILDHIAGVVTNGRRGERLFDLGQDLTYLEQLITKLGNVRVVVIDPVSAYQGKVNSNNNAEIRSLLSPLSNLAAKYGVAILLITHFNKSKDQTPISRVIGSTGLIAAARAGYAVVGDKDDHKVRYFVPLKNNIGNDYDGLAYRVEGVELEEGIETSKIDWIAGRVQARDILSETHRSTESVSDTATTFLKEYLSSGQKPVNTLMKDAKAEGFSSGVIRRASKRLNVKKRKQGLGGSWFWQLPTATTPIAPTEDIEDIEDTKDGEGGEDNI